MARCGATPGEFLAEVLLNLAKALEVLFPPKGDGRVRDAVRAGLLTLGYSEENIEADYIPVMALRNELDVGHVELGLLARDHLEVLHAYTERVEKPFRDLLKTLLDKVEANEFEVEPYQLVVCQS